MLLCEETGKVSVAARGARNPKSKLAAVAQPFTLAKFLIARGRSLDIASQAEVEKAHTHLSGDLLKTAWASYFCELCDAIPEELPDSELFKLLEISLARMDVAEGFDECEIVGRWFEMQYLVLLGYAPTIGRCVACDEKISVAIEDTGRKLFFSPSMGGTLCGACAVRDSSRLHLHVQALRALHQLGRASTPPSGEFWERAGLSSGARRDLREALQRSVFSHLDIRLKSRAFLDEVMAGQQIAAKPAA